MLNDNIRKYRKEKGLSQEEMAVKLFVVRQTISKWENGLSVPDAEVLMNMALLLEVPVSKLLGVEVEQKDISDLEKELSDLNELLAKKKQKEILAKRSDEKRGLIIFASFLSMLAVLGINNPVVSVLISGGCLLFAVIVLYRNLILMTSITTDDMRLKVLRITTLFNISILILGIVFVVLTASDIIQFSEHGEKMFAMLFIACVMIFAGIISPKLPFTRHTGLRLPWTIRDQDTWNLAHRILGYISLPVALLYVACSLTIDSFEQVTLIAMLVWIGIPGGVSFIYFWKKMHGVIC